MDTIQIRQLQAKTTIGTYAWERQVTTKILIDLDIATDCKKTSLTDDIKDTFDYSLLSQDVISWVEKQELKLIDTLAEKMAFFLFEKYSVKWVKISICKPGVIAQAQQVSLVIERSNPDNS